VAKDTADHKPFQILSFDGGGLKGLFAAALLAEVEGQLGISIVDHFDLIAGTSTGGLIALGLAAGLRPAEIVDFFVREGTHVFRSPRRLSRFWRPKHDSAGLRAALINVFGNRQLGTSTKRVVIAAFSLDDNDVYLFKTRHHERLTRDHTELMVDVAMATTAAPTYLPAAVVGMRRLIDGGVWANNPAVMAITEARSMLDIDLEDMRVLSMGTTDDVVSHKSSLARGGYFQWARPAIPLFLRAQSRAGWHTAQHLVGEDNFERVDAPVASGVFQLDQLDAGRIRGLAEVCARQVCPAIKPFTAHLAPPFVPCP
jgi:patatin-like phospholipase/acyl hydrolase